MSIKDTPHKMAMSFAVGLFIGISPFFGLHILSGLACAWLFNLNRVILISAVLISNPWTMIPLYSFCLWVGILVTGEGIDVPALDWSSLTIADLIDGMGQLVVPILIGTGLVGAVSSVGSYFVIHWAICRFRKGEDCRAAKEEGR